MAIQFVCECGKKISVREEYVGKRVRCPACQAVVTVPSSSAVEGEGEGGGGDEGEAEGSRGRGSRRESGKKSSPTLLYAGIIGGVLLLSCCCLGGVGALFYFVLLPANDKQLAGNFPITEKGSWNAFDGKTTVADGVKTPGKVRYKGFKVPLKANWTYIIELLHNGGSADPYLLLQDPDGKTVASDDDSGGGNNARIVYTPTRAGDYRILAATLTGLGDFELRIVERNALPPIPKGPGQPGKGNRPGSEGNAKFLPIPATEKGQWTLQDPIHPEMQAAYKTYSLNLQAGKRYVIDLMSTERIQDPYLFLTDTNGTILAEDDDTGGGLAGLDARIVFVPVNTGTYRIVATTLNRTLGNFTLTVREGGN
jgi:hypothetical protein